MPSGVSAAAAREPRHPRTFSRAKRKERVPRFGEAASGETDAVISTMLPHLLWRKPPSHRELARRPTRRPPAYSAVRSRLSVGTLGTMSCAAPLSSR